MKKRIHYTRNIIINSEKRLIILNSDLTRENNIFLKEDIEQLLISRKSSLEALLKTIKNFQDDFFSKENKVNKLKLTKELLTLLKNNLTVMKEEKMKQFDSLKNLNEKDKKRIQGNLFQDNENKMNYSSNDDLHSSYIKQKNELSLLNFQIQNEIEKIKIMIDIKNKIYLYVKHISFYLNLYREIYCNINKRDSETVSEILKSIRTSIKNEFISNVKEKMETDLEINAVKFKIQFIKDNLINDKFEGDKKYIKPEEIIYEETRENDHSVITGKNKRNSFAGIHEITFSKNILKRPSNNLAKKHLSIDDVMADNFFRNKLIDLFIKNKDNLNNDKNRINNYFNINVNINLGGNKNSCSTSSLENEDDQAKIELDENNSIDESSSQREEDVKDNNRD